MAPPAGAAGEGNAGTAGHALTFRVMRLCRPSVAAERPLRCAAEDLGFPADPPGALGAPPDAAAGWSHRFELTAASDANGLSGALLLPQSFGAIHLGESFVSYVSVANFSSRTVTGVGLKAELQTERTRAVLLDTTGAPEAALAPGERRDALVEADLKAAGPHTLVCSAVYTDADGERKYLPQYFKFTAANPLAVRTKVRALPGGGTLLEAYVENLTKAPLCMEHVRFEPAPPLTCRELAPGAADADADADGAPGSPPPGPLTALLARLQVLPPGGGARHWLFLLERPKDAAADPAHARSAAAAAAIDASGALGRLDMRWRGPLGDGGRLQTQAIMGAPPPRRDVSITLERVPHTVQLEEPFTVLARVRNDSAARTATLRVAAQPAPPAGGAAPLGGVAATGPLSWTLGELPPGGSATVALSCVALARGVQRAPALALAEDAPVAVGTARPLDATPHAEVLVLGGGHVADDAPATVHADTEYA